MADSPLPDRLLAASRGGNFREAKRQVAAGGRDPRLHLLSVWDHTSGQRRPVSLASATAELRALLDDPASDPLWTLRRTQTIATLREFATRLLTVAGSDPSVLGYARAVSDLATALSHEAPPDAP